MSGGPPVFGWPSRRLDLRKWKHLAPLLVGAGSGLGEAEAGVCGLHKGGRLASGAKAAAADDRCQRAVCRYSAACDGVVGLAGTANEQAAGLGKPVVTFPGRGPQFTAEFARMQKRLLGEAVALTEREPALVATELYSVLTDDKRRAAVVRAGRERMGTPGGAERLPV